MGEKNWGAVETHKWEKHESVTHGKNNWGAVERLTSLNSSSSKQMRSTASGEGLPAETAESGCLIDRHWLCRFCLSASSFSRCVCRCSRRS